MTVYKDGMYGDDGTIRVLIAGDETILQAITVGQLRELEPAAVKMKEDVAAAAEKRMRRQEELLSQWRQSEDDTEKATVDREVRLLNIEHSTDTDSQHVAWVCRAISLLADVEPDPDDLDARLLDRRLQSSWIEHWRTAPLPSGSDETRPRR